MYYRDTNLSFSLYQGDDPKPPVDEFVLDYLNHLPVDDPHEERDRLLTYEVDDFYRHRDLKAFRCCVAYWNSKRTLLQHPFFIGSNCHLISIRLSVIPRGYCDRKDGFLGSQCCRILL